MKIFVVTADTSGDLHGAELVRALRARVERSGESLDLVGLGGDALRAEGLRPVAERDAFAVGGLVEVLSSARRIWTGYRELRSRLVAERPDLVLLIDSPDLNLPLAAVAKRAGLRVFYYVAPQVWAWRYGRVRKLRERVDHVGVIFPFEEKLLQAAGVPATFVGHPLVDQMAALRRDLKPDEVALELGLDRTRPIVGLLPGSRRNELRHNLPLMLEAGAQLARLHPEVQVCLLLVSGWGGDIPESGAPLKVIRGRTRQVMAMSQLLLAAPGTVTVEAGLLGVPMVVTHRVNPTSFELIRRLSRVPSSCMVNLIAERGIVPEYLQEAARPIVLTGVLARMLESEEMRAEQVSNLAEMATRLGGAGASERAAERVLEVAAGR